MTAPQLALEWQEEPTVSLRGNVVDAALAWCSCGWRYAASDQSKKANRVEAEEMFTLHREKWCPVALLPPADVDHARLLGGGV